MSHLKNISISLVLSFILIFNSNIITESNQSDNHIPEEITENESDVPIGGVKETCLDVPDEVIVPEWSIQYPVLDPIYTQGFTGNHKAIDIISQTNPTVFSVSDGKVIFAGWMSGYGNTIKIDHGNGFVSLYAHLSKFIIQEGQNIINQQSIGVMGTTGNSTGIHLHFEMRYNNVKLNPDNYLIWTK